MPTFIYMDKYRGFSDALIPLTRVNFLVGENSTGKTSFLELLKVFSYRPFWIFEPKFGTPGPHQRHFLDLISAASENKRTFSVGAISLSRDSSAQDFGLIVTYANVEGRPTPTRVSIFEGHEVRTLDGALWHTKIGDPFRARRVEASSPPLEETLAQRAKRHVCAHHANVGFERRTVSEDTESTPLLIRLDEVLPSGKGSNRRVVAPYPFRSNIVELAPIRTTPRRTYDAPQTEFSPGGEHTPYVIKKRLASKTQAADFLAFLEKAGKDSGLFKSIRVRNYGRGQLAPFEMQVLLGKSALGLENVGYGVSQSLPVLVEMFVRPARTTFTIQQPEVHLHPRAQATFGDLVAELARNEEKRFFVETHSDFSIDRFRLNIREKGRVPSQLLFFDRTEIGNRATPIVIDDRGDLAESQPDAYRSFFLNESLALLS